jgi:hypothetical protein
MEMVRVLAAAAILILSLLPAAARADSAQAQCAFQPLGATEVGAKMPCTFSQRQGYVDIDIEGGKSYSLSPIGNTPGTYKDAEGKPAYRRAGLGSKGLILKLSEGDLYVYW